MKNQNQISNRKMQIRKVGVAGSFQNQMMGNNSTEPAVGEYATILHYSDATAYETIWVSEDGNQCKIRTLDCTFVGNGYGDERYTYKPDPNGIEMLLEWNPKKSQWERITFKVQVIKALQKKLIKKYDWNWADHLPVSIDELYDGVDEQARIFGHCNLIPGVTKEYKERNRVSIIFGMARQYRDPSF